jgi:hypothetical protein
LQDMRERVLALLHGTLASRLSVERATRLAALQADAAAFEAAAAAAVAAGIHGGSTGGGGSSSGGDDMQ